MPRLRLLIRAGVCLPLGIAATFGVANLLALRGINIDRPKEGETTAVLLPDGDALVIRPRQAGLGWSTLGLSQWPVQSQSGDRVKVWPQGGLFAEMPEYRLVNLSLNAAHLPPPRATSTTEYRFGWPARAMWGATHHGGSGCIITQLPPTNVVILKSGIMDDLPFMDFGRPNSPRAYALATGVLPIGFTVDSAFYSALAYAAFFGIGSVRRARRRRRGLCTSCRYNLSGLAPGSTCPECGTPAHPSMPQN